MVLSAGKILQQMKTIAGHISLDEPPPASRHSRSGGRTGRRGQRHEPTLLTQSRQFSRTLPSAQVTTQMRFTSERDKAENVLKHSLRLSCGCFESQHTGDFNEINSEGISR